MIDYPVGSHPHRSLYSGLIAAALREDLGSAGDLTSNSTVDAAIRVEGVLLARQAGRLCGLEVALEVFHNLDSELEVYPIAEDGQDLEAGELVTRVRGDARALLAAERTALNFLGHLSGIATATRDLAARIEKTGTRLVCTRKTTPGLRALEKYAVRIGGGDNHRFGLFDAVLIKDNHRAISGGVGPAIRRAKREVGHLVRIEVEVDDLQQLDEALSEGVDAVLLDNMCIADLKIAVDRCRDRVVTEASGGIGPDTIDTVAQTGVDLISVGWITHSAPTLDVAFELMPNSVSSGDDSEKLAPSFDRLRSRD
jgi:nicotinate-nucleotide pyrophosphorylase (carboxylating)